MPILIIDHPLSVSSICNDVLHPPCSIYMLDIFLHNLSPSPLVYLFVWNPPLDTSYIFCTQSLSSFHNTCPYHYSLFYCSTKIMSSVPSLSPIFSFGTLSFTLTSHICLATSFLFLAGQVSLSCYMLCCCTVTLSHAHIRFMTFWT